MTRSNDTADIKAMLQSRIDALARELAPDGYRAGKYWMARCPWRDDKKAGSFWISTKGAPGAWRDEASGEKGDVFKLIQKVHGFSDFKGVIDWARGWLGVGPVINQATVAAARHKVEQDRQRNDARDADRAAQNRSGAHAMWLKCVEHIDGSPIDRYLATRDIHLAELPRMPGCLRWHPAMKHLETGRVLPAMVVLMVGSDDKPKAVHRTWIMPDGSGKADVSPVRKIWPSYVGATMRLARGETRLSHIEATKRGKLDRLVLCEGVEDGLSLALLCPDLRVWAVGALNNLAHVRIPDCAAEVIVAADNDWGKPQAEKQLQKGLEALLAQRRPVRIARSPIGKDFNDALRGAA